MTCVNLVDDKGAPIFAPGATAPVTDADDNPLFNPVSYTHLLVRSSRFESRTPVPEDLSSAHLVTLSTCSYEFEDARFVVVGVLTPIDPVAAPAGSGE